MKQLTVAFIRAYQAVFRSFIQVALVSAFGIQLTCKQTPTCSEYTIFQVKKHGTIIGLKKGLIRILACH